MINTKFIATEKLPYHRVVVTRKNCIIIFRKINTSREREKESNSKAEAKREVIVHVYRTFSFL